MGKGAADIGSKVTLNIGVIEGGLKDQYGAVRVPLGGRHPPALGVAREQVMAVVHKVLAGYPRPRSRRSSTTRRPIVRRMARWSRSSRRMSRRCAALSLRLSSASEGRTRLWRYREIPAYVYGPFPYGMGSVDEHVDVEDFLHIVRVHVLSAYDYLMSH
jgi:succinyl-diaminopimelate desuccinylase